MTCEPTTYRVKEIFGPTVQGEGAHAGRPCVFLRFAACNLRCSWCDTDFAPQGADALTAGAIVGRLLDVDHHRSRLVVVTGGEPALQWDANLAAALRHAGFTVHMESNGTRRLRAPVDWLTVSPKPQFHGPGDRLLLAPALVASECKVVVDDTVDDDAVDRYQDQYPCEHRFLQPCMDAHYERHLHRTLQLVQRHPAWRLSVQLHKIIGVP
jgi:7-carboxy-7-deazaguanine synthase